MFLGSAVAFAWDLSESEVVEDYILHTAAKEGVSAQVAWDIARCESGFNPLAHNPNDPNGGSFGVFQFQLKTFYNFSSKYGVENPDIKNTAQQIKLAILMFRDGLQSHWTCAKIMGHA